MSSPLATPRASTRTARHRRRGSMYEASPRHDTATLPSAAEAASRMEETMLMDVSLSLTRQLPSALQASPGRSKNAVESPTSPKRQLPVGSAMTTLAYSPERLNAHRPKVGSPLRHVACGNSDTSLSQDDKWGTSTIDALGEDELERLAWAEEQMRKPAFSGPSSPSPRKTNAGSHILQDRLTSPQHAPRPQPVSSRSKSKAPAASMSESKENERDQADQLPAPKRRSKDTTKKGSPRSSMPKLDASSRRSPSRRSPSKLPVRHRVVAATGKTSTQSSDAPGSHGSSSVPPGASASTFAAAGDVSVSALGMFAGQSLQQRDDAREARRRRLGLAPLGPSAPLAPSSSAAREEPLSKLSPPAAAPENGGIRVVPSEATPAQLSPPASVLMELRAETKPPPSPSAASQGDLAPRLSTVTEASERSTCSARSSKELSASAIVVGTSQAPAPPDIGDTCSSHITKQDANSDITAKECGSSCQLSHRTAAAKVAQLQARDAAPISIRSARRAPQAPSLPPNPDPVTSEDQAVAACREPVPDHFDQHVFPVQPRAPGPTEGQEELAALFKPAPTAGQKPLPRGGQPPKVKAEGPRKVLAKPAVSVMRRSSRVRTRELPPAAKRTPLQPQPAAKLTRARRANVPSAPTAASGVQSTSAAFGSSPSFRQTSTGQWVPVTVPERTGAAARLAAQMATRPIERAPAPAPPKAGKQTGPKAHGVPAWLRKRKAELAAEAEARAKRAAELVRAETLAAQRLSSQQRARAIAGNVLGGKEPDHKRRKVAPRAPPSALEERAAERARWEELRDAHQAALDDARSKAEAERLAAEEQDRQAHARALAHRANPVPDWYKERPHKRPVRKAL